MNILWQVLASVIVVVAWTLGIALAGSAIASYGKRREMSVARVKTAAKIVNNFLLFAAAVALLLVWGVNIRNLGIVVSSVLGLVAIGFFAVWSILSNILAGLFLFMSDAFRMGDTVTILPEGISGTVTDIKLMFLVLEDEEGATMHVPNNVMIQKVIKRSKRGAKTTVQPDSQE